jgi:hypothetical protein
MGPNVSKKGGVHTAVPRDIRHIAAVFARAHHCCYVAFDEGWKKEKKGEDKKRTIQRRAFASFFVVSEPVHCTTR